jgi:hypothetical protein
MPKVTRLAVPFFLSVGLLAGALAAVLTARPACQLASTVEVQVPALGAS